MKAGLAIGAGFALGWACEKMPPQYQGPCHLAAEIAAALLGGH